MIRITPESFVVQYSMWERTGLYFIAANLNGCARDLIDFHVFKFAYCEWMNFGCSLSHSTRLLTEMKYIFFHIKIECVTANLSDLFLFVGCDIVCRHRELVSTSLHLLVTNPVFGELEKSAFGAATIIHNFEKAALIHKASAYSVGDHYIG